VDRPHDVLCFACGATLGLSSDGTLCWTCACGKRVRPASDRGTKEAGAEVVALIRTWRRSGGRSWRRRRPSSSRSEDRGLPGAEGRLWCPPQSLRRAAPALL